MEFWCCVMTFSLLILISEANKAHLEPNVRNLQSSSVTFTTYEYDPTLTDVPDVDSTTTNGPEVDSTPSETMEVDPTLTDEPEVGSAIHTNGQTIKRVIRNDRPAGSDETQLGTEIENVFRNIFKNDDLNYCYFGEVFQKNEQYYEFEINPVGNVHISIGFGYASNYSKLKGRTAEFNVQSKTYVLLSKNDNNGEIKVEIQSGSEKVVLTSPEDPQYRPVVCLKGTVFIDVALFNGMKMASIFNANANDDDVVELPNSRKLLKALTPAETEVVVLNPLTGPLALGLIEFHTFTSTTPPTHIFTGHFFDGGDWWMSPNLVDEDNKWVAGTILSTFEPLTSTIDLTVWQQGQTRRRMTVNSFGRTWERKVYALYDSGDKAEVIPDTSGSVQLPHETKSNCSGFRTCKYQHECQWPRSVQQDLRPGVCIKKVCKIIVEAHVRTGLYKPDGDRLIGGEIALRLIAPSDVGVETKGIPMIKALLDRAEDFEDISPTGEHEFGGYINPPRGSGSAKRYFNDVDLYYDSYENACDTKLFIPIRNSAGLIIGFAKMVEFFDYIRCTPHYGLVTNLVTNALHPQNLKAVDIYENKHYQRVDPNIALDYYDSQGDYDRDWPDWPATLPKGLSENLYHNNIDTDADHYYSRDRLDFFKKDEFSAVTDVELGLGSCYKKCVAFYFFFDFSVYHVTTFVRQRVQDGEWIDSYYTEFHLLMWYYGLNYRDIDFSQREMTPYDEYNIPSWFNNKNGADPDLIEASYISLPDLHTAEDSL